MLRSRGLEGHKFRRQHAAGPYILDFTCAEARLAVEVDGSQHYTPCGLAATAAQGAVIPSLRGIRPSPQPSPTAWEREPEAEWRSEPSPTQWERAG